MTHTTFTIERTYDATPAQVFNAFADPKIKARWFTGPDDSGPESRELDFRIGGREINRGSAPDGSESSRPALADARRDDVAAIGPCHRALSPGRDGRMSGRGVPWRLQ